MKRFRLDIPIGTLQIHFDAASVEEAERFVNAIDLAEIHPPVDARIEWHEVGADDSASLEGMARGKAASLASVMDATRMPVVDEEASRLQEELERLKLQLQSER